MAQKLLTKQKVKIVGGAGWVSAKTGLSWANLDYKTDKGFKGNIFINEANPETIALLKELDQKMGQEVTLVTMIEVQ